MTELILYGRRACHLCDDLRQGLLAFQPGYGFRLREIDIDADPELRARYGLLIPVLCLGDREICRFELDPAALKQALEAG